MTTMQLIDISDKVKIFLDRKFRYSKSFSTRRTYQAAVDKFQEFLTTKHNLNLNEVLTRLESRVFDPLEILDEFFTFLSNYKPRNGKTCYSNASVSLYIIAVKEFMNSQNLHVYSEDLKQKFRLPKKETVFEEGLTKEKIVRVLHNSSPKLQIAILMCASSAMRLGELVQLKISDIDFSTNPTTIHLRKETTKTRETRFTHISAEATKSLKDYLRRTCGWSEKSNMEGHIFMANNRDYTNPEEYNKAARSACTALQQSLLLAVRSVPELCQKNENGRNSIHFHAFRAWFKTQVTNAHQSDFAEALMGHKSVKLMYFRQNAKDRLKTYLEVELAVTVSDFTRVENTMEDLRSELASVKLELEIQKKRIERTEKYEKIDK